MIIWVIERSIEGGAPWMPVSALGFKVKRSTAEKLARENNAYHAKCPIPVCNWRDRAAAYEPLDWKAAL